MQNQESQSILKPYQPLRECLVDLFNQPVSDEALSKIAAWLNKAIFPAEHASEPENTPAKIICAECRYYEKTTGKGPVYHLCRHEQARCIISGQPQECREIRSRRGVCKEEGQLFEPSSAFFSDVIDSVSN